jgi:hypothetical protein
MDYLAAIHVFHRLLICVYQVDDGGGLARTWRAVEQYIWEIFLIQHIEENVFVVRVQNDVFKLGGAVFFAPGLRFFVDVHYRAFVKNFILFG